MVNFIEKSDLTDEQKTALLEQLGANEPVSSTTIADIIGDEENENE